ncbi:MAG: 30S ribosomal protein S16 [Patescibacteria group bacterium]
MLSLRLSRLGKSGQPSFRLIVQDHRRSPKGKCIEVLGNYLPATKNKTLNLNKDRIEYWVSVGARPSDTVAVLLKKEGFQNMEKFIAARNKKRKKKGEEAAAPAPAAAAPAAAVASATPAA